MIIEEAVLTKHDSTMFLNYNWIYNGLILQEHLKIEPSQIKINEDGSGLLTIPIKKIREYNSN